ncbi:hypothetical protein TNCV_1788231 [Trichonephila clavipes]|nr:hypothetical protein TNCV_1788231 [Trichonephila clavipes]
MKEGRFVPGTFRSKRMRVLNRSRQNDRLPSMPRLWRWRSVVSSSIFPSGEFRRANSYCHLYGAQRQGPTCHDEFRGPRSNYARQMALATTAKIQ